MNIAFEPLMAYVHQALSLSYAPYSKFHVGAVIQLEDGNIILGANQENASYPLCMCAERVALYNKVMNYPSINIQRILIIARKNEDHNLVPAAPCGACRQVIVEYEMNQQSPIEVAFMHQTNNWVIVESSLKLLPHSFTSDDL